MDDGTIEVDHFYMLPGDLLQVSPWETAVVAVAAVVLAAAIHLHWRQRRPAAWALLLAGVLTLGGAAVLDRVEAGRDAHRLQALMAEHGVNVSPAVARYARDTLVRRPWTTIRPAGVTRDADAPWLLNAYGADDHVGLAIPAKR